MREDARLVTRGALGGDHDLIAHVTEREADLLLAVGIGVGGVKITDAAVLSRAEELHGLLLRAALHRQTAHGGLRHDETGFSERQSLHLRFLPLDCNLGYSTTLCAKGKAGFLVIIPIFVDLFSILW